MNNDTSLGAFLQPEEIAEIQSHLMQMLGDEILRYNHAPRNGHHRCCCGHPDPGA